MAIVEKEFSLDIVPAYLPPTIHVSEYDIGRSYSVSLLNDGQVFTIPEGASASIEGTIEDYIMFSERHSRGVFSNNDATISNNKIHFSLTEEMTAISGKVWCKIKLTLNDEPISTCGFILMVDRAGLDAGDLIRAKGFDEQIKDAAEDYIDRMGFEPKAISYESDQNLSPEQKHRAASNIGARTDNSIRETGIITAGLSIASFKPAKQVHEISYFSPGILNQNYTRFNRTIEELAEMIRDGSHVSLVVTSVIQSAAGGALQELIYPDIQIPTTNIPKLQFVLFYPTGVYGKFNSPSDDQNFGLDNRMLQFDDDGLEIRFSCRDPRVYKNTALIYQTTVDGTSIPVIEFIHED